MEQIKAIIALLLSLIAINSNLGVNQLPTVVEASQFSQFDSTIPKVDEKMLYPQFWIKNTDNAHNIIMTSLEIEEYNRENVENSQYLFDLESYKNKFSKEELKSLINGLSQTPKGNRYDSNGKLINQGYYSKILDNLNIQGLSNTNSVRYGITIKRTEMRTFPTSDRIFSTSGDYQFDNWIETAVYPVEPLIILGTSKDGKWFFAQMYNYLGWVLVEDVALTTKDKLFSFANSEDFIVVTGSRVFTNYNHISPDVSELQLNMGVKVPLADKKEISSNIYDQNPAGSYVVKLPTRDDKGNLVIKLALISRSSDVSLGYLPYTRANIINQAFKMQGQRYGWGGMFNSVDCSAYIMDIFRSMGIRLPRNAGQQGKTTIGAESIMASTMSIKDRYDVIDSLSPGSALYLEGHVVLYLGKYKEEHYCIHSFSGFNVNERVNGRNQLKKYNAMTVAVTPLDIISSGGKGYIESFYGVKDFRLIR